MESISQLTTDLHCKINFSKKEDESVIVKIFTIINGYDKFIITISKHKGKEFYSIEYNLTNQQVEDNLSEVSNEDKLFIINPINILLREINDMRACALDFNDTSDLYFIECKNNWCGGKSILLAKSYIDCKNMIRSNITLEISRTDWEFAYSNVSEDYESDQISTNSIYDVIAHPATVKAIFILNELKRRLNI